MRGLLGYSLQKKLSSDPGRSLNQLAHSFVVTVHEKNVLGFLWLTVHLTESPRAKAQPCPLPQAPAGLVRHECSMNTTCVVKELASTPSCSLPRGSSGWWAGGQSEAQCPMLSPGSPGWREGLESHPQAAAPLHFLNKQSLR